jgi:hypothetical protein
MFLNHRKLRASDRITMVAVEIVAGNVVEVAHEVPAPKRTSARQGRLPGRTEALLLSTLQKR